MGQNLSKHSAKSVKGITTKVITGRNIKHYQGDYYIET